MAVVVALVAVVTALGIHSCSASAQSEVEARARAIHRETPLVDGHNDYPWLVRQNAAGDLALIDISTPKPALMTDIPRLRAGGVGGQFWSVYVPTTLKGPAAVQATLEQIDVVHRMTRVYADTLELALTAADVQRIFAAGRIASLIAGAGRPRP